MQSEHPKLPARSERKKTSFITAYGPKRRHVVNFPSTEGRTKQSFKDECDINVIMRRYQKTGVVEHVRKNKGVYADTTAYDFQAAMDTVANAQSAFEELPARIRDRFDNDPAKLLVFIQDPKNTDEAIELGLCEKPAPAVPGSLLPGAGGAQSSGSGDEPAPNQGDQDKPAKPKK